MEEREMEGGIRKVRCRQEMEEREMEGGYMI
jgi:hypothetical protein